MADTILESDPQDIMMDDNGDIVLDEEGLHFVSGIPGVIQAVRIRMLFVLGEWFLNLDIGIPYWDKILGDDYNEDRVRSIFTAAILDAPGVVAITTLQLQRNPDRTLDVTWSATCLFGDTVPDTLNLRHPSQPSVT